MTRVLLAGATGHAGKSILKELKQRGYFVRALVRNQAKSIELGGIADEIKIVDVTVPHSLAHVAEGIDVVISALGKSVSLNDRSKPSFREVDYQANKNILEVAVKSGVKKFIYLSAFRSEAHPELTYFKVHEDFSNELRNSGLAYSIIKPPAIFSSFIDLLDMAKKGMLACPGKGDKRTNPIYEGDLARICVDAIESTTPMIEAGGKKVYTRYEIMELAALAVGSRQKVRSIPLWVAEGMAGLAKWIDRNSYDKLAFFLKVSEHDILAPQVGEKTLEEYFKEKAAMR